MLLKFGTREQSEENNMSKPLSSQPISSHDDGLNSDERKERKKLEIERLRNELFNEEAKLIVMQKIKAYNSKNSVQNQQVDDNHGLDEDKNDQKQSTKNYQSKVPLALRRLKDFNAKGNLE